MSQESKIHITIGLEMASEPLTISERLYLLKTLRLVKKPKSPEGD
jgi:hypothetical protein